MSTHVAKLKRENNASLTSVHAVLPFWDRLAESPLREFAGQQLAELLQSTLRDGTLQYSTLQHGDVYSIYSVVPASDPNEVLQHFQPAGYADLTIVHAGAGGAMEDGLCVAHWTLCTDGMHSRAVHLTALPSLAMLKEQGAMMLWAQDLFTPAGWRTLQQRVS